MQLIPDLPAEIASAWAAQGGDRVFSLMGPNGSGKSKLLEKTKQHLLEKGIACLLLPPVRSLSQFTEGTAIRSALSLIPGPDDPDEQWWALVKKLLEPGIEGSGVGGRIPLTFETALSHLLWQLAINQTDQAERYLVAHAEFKEGKRDAPPSPPDSNPLLALRIKIENILGYPTKIAKVATRDFGRPERLEIAFERDGSSFSPEGLSDGEKQILLVSVFLVGKKAAERLVFLVDEPELFLNEALAAELWQRFEDSYPNAIFLYATHSPSFATRAGVHQPYVMRRNGSLDRMDGTQPIPPQILREIVGARVQLLRTDANPIFCEDALTQHILDDLFSGEKVVAIPVHNRDTVINAVRKEQGWHLLRSEGPKHCGAIDRDTADDEEVGKLEKLGVFCFPRYEAESLLLDPVLATWAFSLAGPKLSPAKYNMLLIECGRARLEFMLHKLSVHVARQQRHEPLRFSVGAAGVENIRVNTAETLIPKFEQRARALCAALDAGDINSILTSFKGKCLYATMQTLLGKPPYRFDLPEPQQWYLQLRSSKGFEQTIAQVSWLAAFRAKIKDFFAT